MQCWHLLGIKPRYTVWLNVADWVAKEIRGFFGWEICSCCVGFSNPFCSDTGKLIQGDIYFLLVKVHLLACVLLQKGPSLFIVFEMYKIGLFNTSIWYEMFIVSINSFNFEWQLCVVVVVVVVVRIKRHQKSTYMGSGRGGIRVHSAHKKTPLLLVRYYTAKFRTMLGPFLSRRIMSIVPPLQRLLWHGASGINGLWRTAQSLINFYATPISRN